MWQRLFVYLWVSLFYGLVLAATPMPDQEALSILKKITDSAHNTSFQGVYMHQHHGNVETVRIFRLIDKGLVHERRETLDGPPREMVRHGDQVSIYLPDGIQLKNFDPARNQHLFPHLLQSNPENLLANYQMVARGVERVADVQTQVMDLMPRDNLRYPHRLWVHPATGLLVKAAVLLGKRDYVESYAFSHLQIGANVDKKMLLPVRSVMPVASKSVRAPDLQGWLIKNPPKGFKLEQEALRYMHTQAPAAIHHFYTDGMVSVSVFLDQMQADLPVGATRQGVLSTFSRQDGNAHITVLGEVPPNTVEQFAAAYQRIQ